MIYVLVQRSNAVLLHNSLHELKIITTFIALRHFLKARTQQQNWIELTNERAAMVSSVHLN